MKKKNLILRFSGGIKKDILRNLIIILPTQSIISTLVIFQIIYLT